MLGEELWLPGRTASGGSAFLPVALELGGEKGNLYWICDLLGEALPRSGGVAINTIFCTVWPTWAGDHRSFRAVVWAVPTAFQLGVHRK